MGKFRRKDTALAQQALWLRPEEIVTGPHPLCQDSCPSCAVVIRREPCFGTLR
jgi:hypothetical protein